MIEVRRGRSKENKALRKHERSAISGDQFAIQVKIPVLGQSQYLLLVLVFHYLELGA